ncbi:MAG: hypothetical protein ACI86X_001553 [Moritella sp.]|jgi:hypothetical protein
MMTSAIKIQRLIRIVLTSSSPHSVCCTAEGGILITGCSLMAQVSDLLLESLNIEAIAEQIY